MPRVEVLRTVDLDVHAPLVEEGVEVPPAARNVTAHHLAGRFRQMVGAAQRHEIEFRQRMRPACRIDDGFADQAASGGAAQAVEHGPHIVGSDQSLLQAGGDDGPRFDVGTRPLGRVDE